jgi:hypothetical protein
MMCLHVVLLYLMNLTRNISFDFLKGVEGWGNVLLYIFEF